MEQHKLDALKTQRQPAPTTTSMIKEIRAIAMVVDSLHVVGSRRGQESHTLTLQTYFTEAFNICFTRSLPITNHQQPRTKNIENPLAMYIRGIFENDFIEKLPLNYGESDYGCRTNI